MSKIEKFEDIQAWKKGRELTRQIYTITLREAFFRDFGLRDQIRRSSVSIMSNIAEGFERGGNKEFIQFLSVAKGSAGEVRSQLYVALDVEHIQRDDFDRLYILTKEVGNLIGGFIRYLKKAEHKGPKFKSE